MKFINEDKHKVLMEQVQKALNYYNEFKKTFDKECYIIRTEESKKYSAQLKNETITIKLTHKANNATTQTQVEQQTIENIKSELREPIVLTKEVAHASSRSQIT